MFSTIGATAPSTYGNAGHGNNLSFIVTGDGAAVINDGGSHLLAKALHHEIQEITDQPVKLVFNENGQGRALLVNSYWVDQGVKIVAHAMPPRHSRKVAAVRYARPKHRYRGAN